MTSTFRNLDSFKEYVNKDRLEQAKNLAEQLHNIFDEKGIHYDWKPKALIDRMITRFAPHWFKEPGKEVTELEWKQAYPDVDSLATREDGYRIMMSMNGPSIFVEYPDTFLLRILEHPDQYGPLDVRESENLWGLTEPGPHEWQIVIFEHAQYSNALRYHWHKKLSEIKTQFDLYEELKPIRLKRDIEQLLSLLGRRGYDRTRLVKMKKKYGVHIDPSEIDDKTLVDLI